jgi:hypothetical protein
MTNLERERADQSISASFTRIMKATTSRLGVLTDPPLVALASAVFLVALLAALQFGAPQVAVRVLTVLLGVPIAVAVIVTLALSGARGKVVSWLASVPFPVENMNSVLNGLGEMMDVTFKSGGPTSAELNKELDAVHPDVFVTKVTPEEGTVEQIEIRIGVVDSKRNPSATNHERYERVRAIVDRVLVPLSARHPITEVRVR